MIVWRYEMDFRIDTQIFAILESEDQKLNAPMIRQIF